MRHLGTLGYGVLAVCLALLGWEGLHWYSEGWVPSLTRVGGTFLDVTFGLEWLDPLAVTGRRLLIAFLATFGLGVLLGTVMGLTGWAEAFGRPLLVMGLAIPDPVYFMLGLLLLGTTEFAAMVALVVAVLPLVVNVTLSGVQSRDRHLDEMSLVYGLPLRVYANDVLLRQVLPIIVAAARTAFAFSWKVLVLMEALTQPNGVGAEIYYAFRLLRPDVMIVYALLFIVIMNVVERGVFARVERAALANRS